MVGERKSFVEQIEEKLGLPPLSQVGETLRKFPDVKQLQLIKEVLLTAERISRSVPEIDKIIEVIREINSMPLEKLEKLEKVLKRIEKIIKTAPDELRDFLASLTKE